MYSNREHASWSGFSILRTFLLTIHRRTSPSKMRTGGVRRPGPCPAAAAPIPVLVTARRVLKRKRGTGSEGLRVALLDHEGLQNLAATALTAESAARAGTLTRPSSIRLPKRKRTADVASAVGRGRGRKGSVMASLAARRRKCVSLRVLT
jgi:hypothetical protein